MNALYDAIRLAHILAGTAALLAFWTTAALRKGTPLHRRTGTVYMAAMLGVLVTSPILAAFAYAGGRWILGTFLLYLVLITGTAVWLAWHAIRKRRDLAAHYGSTYRAIAGVNLAGGLGMFAVGVHAGSVLLGGMSIIGVIIGGQMLVGAQRRESDPRWWVRRHVAAICGCGIATHIAFMNIGLSHVIPADYAQLVQMLGWFGPVVIGNFAGWALGRKYGGGRTVAQAA